MSLSLLLLRRDLNEGFELSALAHIYRELARGRRADVLTSETGRRTQTETLAGTAENVFSSARKFLVSKNKLNWLGGELKQISSNDQSCLSYSAILCD